MYSQSLDGTTHINVYSRGKTHLGQMLSNFAETPFNHPRYGRFSSIEGLWYWLSVPAEKEGRDGLRDKSGFAAKKLGRSLRGEDWNDSPEFKRDITLGIFAKLAIRPELVADLKASTLPLVHYYVAWGKVIDMTDRDWTHKVYVRIRELLQLRSPR